MQKHICRFFDHYAELIHYLIVGALTTIVSLGTYVFLVLTVLNPCIPVQLQIANVLSWIIAVAFAYVTNRKFVFHSSNSHIIKEFLLFVSARLGSLLIDMGGMFLLVTCLGKSDKLAKILVQAIIIVVNYLLSKLFVFRNRF